MPDAIYERPRDYDLEHEHDDADVRFHVALARRLGARRILELGGGSGRVTVPLATAVAAAGGRVVALDAVPAMLAEGERKRVAAPPAVARAITLVEGDMRTWASPEPFDLVTVPCSSVTHLVGLEDRLATWRRAWDNLRPGGHFAVDVVMPHLAAFGDSLGHRARALVEIDADTTDTDGRRLLRYRTTTYVPHEQRADVRFLYDRFDPGERGDRWVSDFASHVYFPCELELLFLWAGFEVAATYGDYRGGPLRATSQEIVMVGRRP